MLTFKQKTAFIQSIGFVQQRNGYFKKPRKVVEGDMYVLDTCLNNYWIEDKHGRIVVGKLPYNWDYVEKNAWNRK